MATPMPKIVRRRPYRLAGSLRIGDMIFDFASGGSGWSIPYGSYPIDNSAGSWGKRHGAIGLNDDTIWDPQLGRHREGIEIHSSNHDTSAGCVITSKFSKLKAAIFAMIKASGQAFLHIGPTGAAITPTKVSPLPPVIYVAEHHDDDRVVDHPRHHRMRLAHHHRTRYAGA